ncbi:MAG TPA: ABC transporter permease [Gemmataceae bacterium]|jgi:simple sugar transport system permease protein|nr:ABC transporter permease [Gemmataceae bacterium]
MSGTEQIATDIGLWGIPLAVLGGAIRVGTPILYVSLGECITEKSGRVNLGLEGTLVMGAVTGYGISYVTRLAGLPPEVCPWVGVLAAGIVGMLLGAMHAGICNLPRVNSVAVGIAMMVFGVALAFCLGKNLIQPVAPKLPAIEFGAWSSIEQLSFALRVNALFLIGVLLAPFLWWALRSTRWGMILRLAGESEEASLAMGYNVNTIRTYATALGGFLAGVGGSYLSLYYPGSWNEQLSSGQGLMAVALVIFARWNPMYCLGASLLFGGVGSLGSALQGQDLSSTFLAQWFSPTLLTYLTSAAPAYLWNAAPYILTLFIMVLTSSRSRALAGAPGALTAIK